MKLTDIIVETDLADITELSLPGKNISSLDGMELFTNLEELDISNNKITDISVLKNLSKLTKLKVKNNPITDYYSISPIYDQLISIDFKKDYDRAVCANKLKAIGVFKGTGKGFELYREPTRLEGLIMLIRLLGKEAEALEIDTTTSAFTDVPPWAVAYTNYAFEKGLAGGIGNGKFGSSQVMDAKSYVTFILRALGYSDKQGDFTWSGAIIAAQSIGLYNNPMQVELSNEVFLREHVADLSYRALGTRMHNSEVTLIQKQVEDNVIDRELAEELGFE